MAKNDKKPTFPAKPCPQCGKLIHARLKKHEACGWEAAENGAAPAVAPKASGKVRKAAPARAGGISLVEIRAVKAVVDKLGADKVQQLAAVLGN